MNDLEQLVRRTVAGDANAWRALQGAIAPSVVAVARRHRQLRGKGLSSLPDDIAEITAATLERLARSDFKNLRRFEQSLSATSDDAPWAQRFDDWLYGVVDFVIRDHLRKRFGRAPRPRDPGAPKQPSKRDLQTQAGRLDDENVDRGMLRTLGMTSRLTAAEIFAHVARDFAPEEAEAIRLYYVEDRSFEDIAVALRLASAKEADKLIRKLNARLRYRFDPKGDTPPPG